MSPQFVGRSGGSLRSTPATRFRFQTAIRFSQQSSNVAVPSGVKRTARSAQRISGALLMQEYSAVDEDVLDAIGEVTNMVLGNVKTALEEELGPMGLSIPTVIYGRNFTTRSVGKSQWTVVPFDCDGHRVDSGTIGSTRAGTGTA